MVEATYGRTRGGRVGLEKGALELDAGRNLVGAALADEASDGWGEGGDEDEWVAHELNVCSCWPVVGAAGLTEVSGRRALLRSSVDGVSRPPSRRDSGRMAKEVYRDDWR